MFVLSRAMCDMEDGIFSMDFDEYTKKAYLEDVLISFESGLELLKVRHQNLCKNRELVLSLISAEELDDFLMELGDLTEDYI